MKKTARLTRRALHRLDCGARRRGGPAALRAHAAEFEYKMGHSTPAVHPFHKHLLAVSERIGKETGGRMKLNVFPNSQLGGDNDLLSQVRSGAIEICQPAGLILASILPLTAINGMGFAFAELRQGLADDGRRPRKVRARPDHRQGRSGADGAHLGSRLPPDHQQHQADQVRRRPRRHEAARARRAGAGVAVQGARHASGQHAVRRGLYLAADQGRGRPGKSDVDHRRGQVLRGAEVLLA